MPTLDNATIVRRFLEEPMNTGNLAVFDELVSPQVVLRGLWHKPIDPITKTQADTWQGIDPLKDDVSYNRRVFRELQVRVEDLIEAGDTVVAHSRTQGTHISGKTVDFQALDIIRLADGKVVEVAGQWDRLGYWQQLGFVPETAELVQREQALVPVPAPQEARADLHG
jgi:ketosteroid isomerase-like protein